MTKKDATQDKGVSDDSVIDSDTKGIKAEVDMSGYNYAEAIADKLEEERAEEEGYDVETDEEERPEDKNEEEAEESEESEESESEEEAKEQETDEEDEIKSLKTKQAEIGLNEKEKTRLEELEPDHFPEKEVELVVDGEKRKVPLSKVHDAGIRALQKESAADKRLEEATRIKEEALKLVANVKPSAEQVDADKVSAEKLGELRNNFIHQNLYGTEEEAAEAMVEWEKALISFAGTAQPTPSFDPNDLKVVLKQVTLEERIYAPPEEGGYGDLMADPILRDQTALYVDKLVAAGEGSLDDFETYRKAGDAMRLIGSTLSPNYKAPILEKGKAISFEEKKEKKRKIDNLKSASSKAQIEDAEEESGEESASSVIAQMRKDRGQMI